jgi:hypothetical protein
MQLDEYDLEEECEGAMIFQRQSKGTVKIQSKNTVGGLRSSWLYLDTCMTNDQITNPAYLTGIYTEAKPLTMHTNLGSSMSRQCGKLGTVLFWVNQDGIASVIHLGHSKRTTGCIMIAPKMTGTSSARPQKGM